MLRTNSIRLGIYLFILFAPVHIWAIRTKVVLDSGEPESLRKKAEIVLTEILNSCNKRYESDYSFEPIKDYFTEEAFSHFTELVEKTNLYAIQREYRSFLIVTQEHFYEVRDIKVRVSLGNTVGLPYQYLVFVLNESGTIVNVHFALRKHHYHDIIQQGREFEDLAYREKIIHFIELYRTAYCRKDLEFVKATLSDDALIIVGYVVKSEKQRKDYLGSSHLNRQQIQFLHLGKNEYLNRLEKVFSSNDFIEVLFDNINIVRHPQFDKIYGVQLKQRWNSSNYSDEGYLFLMVDFIQPEEPIIHVRAWQPEKFEDGSTISIYDFDIIE